MNGPEGLLRIATAMRRTGYALAALSILAALVIALQMQQWSDQVFVIVIGALIAGLLYTAGRILAWIIEGFAAPRG